MGEGHLCSSITDRFMQNAHVVFYWSTWYEVRLNSHSFRIGFAFTTLDHDYLAIISNLNHGNDFNVSSIRSSGRCCL